MSKKIAAGSDCIVLDVKMGSGAFMKNIEEARELSKKMVAIGNLAKRKTMAVITNMDVPLGENIGNLLEVKEAIDILRGKGPEDLLEVSIVLATCMVMLCNNVKEEEARHQVEEAIKTGAAYNKLIEVVKAQGGNIEWIKNYELMPKAKYSVEVISQKDGFIEKMNTEEIGKISCYLGAGREKKEDVIDFTAGLKILKKTHDYVKAGDVLAILYTNKEEKIEEAKNDYINSLTFTENKVEKPKLIYEICK
jgi:pyrimidine-nucleoside phosphorylase